MELALLLYAASIADNLRSGAGLFITPLFIGGLVGVVLFVVSCVNMLDFDETDSSRFKHWLQVSRLSRKLVLTCFFAWTTLMFVSHLVPTRKDVYVMAGGYVALKVARTPVVQDTADSVVNSIEKWLDKELVNANIESPAKPAKGGK